MTRFRTYTIALPPQTKKSQEGREPQTDKHLPQSPFALKVNFDNDIWHVACAWNNHGSITEHTPPFAGNKADRTMEKYPVFYAPGNPTPAARRAVEYSSHQENSSGGGGGVAICEPVKPCSSKKAGSCARVNQSFLILYQQDRKPWEVTQVLMQKALQRFGEICAGIFKQSMGARNRVGNRVVVPAPKKFKNSGSVLDTCRTRIL